MAKKQAVETEPIVEQEPERPEELFRIAESEVAPPSPRRTGERRSSLTSANAPEQKSFGARSARERRAARAPRSSEERRERRERRSNDISPETVAELLANPTITVTEAQLREEYGFIIADLRSMAVLAAGLVVLLVVLATVLPT